MEEETLGAMRQLVDTDKAEVVDARSMGGEVIKIPLLNLMQMREAVAAVADNLAWFMEKVTGRGYQKAEQVYELSYMVREPGHECYGLKVSTEENCVIIHRVAILEDETIFGRYVSYLRTGIFA